MQTKEQYGVKTGTLKPQMKPCKMLDFEYAEKKAKAKCERTRRDTVVLHDERDGLSIVHVNNLHRLRITRNILFGYHYDTQQRKAKGGSLWW